MTKTRRFLLVLFSVLNIFSLSLASTTLKLKLQVNPTNYQGACPVNITFTGAITASAACGVSYRVTRSDGWTGQMQSLSFPAAGTQPFNHTEPWTQSFTGWIAIEAGLSGVRDVQKFTSNKVNLDIVCVPPLAPVIKKVDWGSCHHTPNRRYVITGEHFGPSRGIRQVTFNNKPLAGPYYQWNDSQIEVEGLVVSNNCIEGFPMVAIQSNGQVISNVFPGDIWGEIDSINPSTVKKGDEIVLRVWGVPVSTSEIIYIFFAPAGKSNLGDTIGSDEPNYFISCTASPGGPTEIHFKLKFFPDDPIGVDVNKYGHSWEIWLECYSGLHRVKRVLDKYGMSDIGYLTIN